jgi:hypothetical protein
MKRNNWSKYSFEFLSIFIAVLSAFALNNWNENNRDDEAADKILAEIYNGLEKDQIDIQDNIGGHKSGISACDFWRRVVLGEEVKLDSLSAHYSNITRDFISIQNISGYESLKAKGLELIENDSLRFDIITLYEYHYSVLKKFEEEYYEMQYQHNYYKTLNSFIAPNLKFNNQGEIIGMSLPLKVSDKERNILLSYLWKIQMNRNFVLRFYVQTEKQVMKLREEIGESIGR